MQFASLIGFAAVFVALAWSVSIVAKVGAHVLAPAVRRFGPAAERRIIELAACAPLFVATAVVAVLIGVSVAGRDHCQHHAHEAHLCLVHGAVWASQAWAIALVAVGVLVLAFRSIRLVVRPLSASRALVGLRALSLVDGDIRRLATPDPICFVTRDGEIFVSTGTWDALNLDERAAIIAHERAHIANRDVARGGLLDLFELFGAPLTSLRGRWNAVTERLCDNRAANVTGDAESVASAIVKLARLHRATPAGTMAFTAERDDVTSRVHAVLAGLPAGDRAGLRALQIACALAAATVTVLATHAPLVHDLIEDLAG